MKLVKDHCPNCNRMTLQEETKRGGYDDIPSQKIWWCTLCDKVLVMTERKEVCK